MVQSLRNVAGAAVRCTREFDPGCVLADSPARGVPPEHAVVAASPDIAVTRSNLGKRVVPISTLDAGLTVRVAHAGQGTALYRRARSLRSRARAHNLGLANAERCANSARRLQFLTPH